MLELKSLSSHISEWREEQLNIISKEILQNFTSIQLPLKEECEKRKRFITFKINMDQGNKL